MKKHILITIGIVTLVLSTFITTFTLRERIAETFDNITFSKNDYIAEIKDSYLENYNSDKVGAVFEKFLDKEIWTVQGVGDNRYIVLEGFCKYLGKDIKAAFTIKNDANRVYIDKVVIDSVTKQPETVTLLLDAIYKGKTEIKKADLEINDNTETVATESSEIRLNNLYVNDEYGYSVQYPDEFIGVSENEDGFSIGFLLDYNIFLLSWADSNSVLPYDEFIQSQGFDISEAEKIDIPGALYAYQFKKESNNTLYKQIFCFNKGTWYSLQLGFSDLKNVSKDRVDELTTTFDEMVKTFTIF